MRPLSARPLIYKITPGRLTDENFEVEAPILAARCAEAAEMGISLIQIRERSISARRLFELTRLVVDSVSDHPAKVLVNERFDVAIGAGADGVHLPAQSIPIEDVRRSVPDGFVLGVSTHTIGELERAFAAGADLAVFGPVFETPGKSRPIGLEGLRAGYSAANDLPVLALGGVTAEDLPNILAAGAAGFAAIRSLDGSTELAELRNVLDGASN